MSYDIIHERTKMRKWIRIALPLLMLVLVCARPGSTAPAQVSALSMQPMRAAQILTFGCENWEEVNLRFREFREAGINTVIVRVFHNPGDRVYRFANAGAGSGVYFNTSACPVVDDVLGRLCAYAHYNGLRLHAWITTRKADYGISTTEHNVMAYDFATGKARKEYGLSPLIPETREYLSRLFSDLARYPIDGILLQDDLILRHNEGFQRSACQEYYRETGKSPNPKFFYKGIRRTSSGRWVVDSYTDEFWAWTRWKNGRILDLIEHLADVVHRRRPGIPIGMNCYYEAITNPKGALAWLSQDIFQASERQIDYFALMFYHRQIGQELGLTTHQVFDLMDRSLSSALLRIEPERLLVKAQTIDWNTTRKIPGNELEGFFSTLVKYPRLSLSVVPSGKYLDLQLVSKYYK